MEYREQTKKRVVVVLLLLCKKKKRSLLLLLLFFYSAKKAVSQLGFPFLHPSHAGCWHGPLKNNRRNPQLLFWAQEGRNGKPGLDCIPGAAAVDQAWLGEFRPGTRQLGGPARGRD
jgi:hypothetical protein